MAGCWRRNPFHYMIVMIKKGEIKMKLLGIIISFLLCFTWIVHFKTPVRLPGSTCEKYTYTTNQEGYVDIGRYYVKIRVSGKWVWIPRSTISSMWWE